MFFYYSVGQFGGACFGVLQENKTFGLWWRIFLSGPFVAKSTFKIEEVFLSVFLTKYET